MINTRRSISRVPPGDSSRLAGAPARIPFRSRWQRRRRRILRPSIFLCLRRFAGRIIYEGGGRYESPGAIDSPGIQRTDYKSRPCKCAFYRADSSKCTSRRRRRRLRHLRHLRLYLYPRLHRRAGCAATRKVHPESAMGSTSAASAALRRKAVFQV